jgi:TolB-like protein
MFTDIVGFSSVMSRDKTLALKLLSINKKIHRAALKEYNGKWLKEIGDGVLASFDNVTDAVYCAWKIVEQSGNIDHLHLRIGLHLGEVELSGGDIYGDGVNIASRIEGIAKTNQVYCSESIYNNIRNNSSIRTSFAGEHQLKNIPNPIKVFCVENVELTSNIVRSNSRKYIRGFVAITLTIVSVFVATYYFTSFRRNEEHSSGESAPPSIAVLAFEDMSLDKSQAYLGDGISEEVILLLSEVDGLKVIGRTSSFSFKNKNMDLKEIGRQLDATYILEGSVQKSNDIIRVNVRLNDSRDGSDIWSQQFENDLVDIFAIQDSIARSVVNLFELTLSLSHQANPPTNNIGAYESYLKGRELYQSGLSGTEEAIGYFEEAIRLDPNFLDATALLSEAYWSMILYNLGNPSEYANLAKTTTRKAIEINPDAYQGYKIRGFIDFSIDHNWDESLKNFKVAIENGMPLPDPEYLNVITALTKDTERHVKDLKTLLDNDPLSVDLMTELSRALLWDQDYPAVIENGLRVVRIDPNNTSVMRHMADAYLFSGDMDNAIQANKDLYEINPKYSPQGYIASLVSLGDTSEARQVLENVVDELNPAKKAFCYQYLGELDSAFKYYNISIDQKDFFATLLKIEPHFNYIKNEPGYEDLLERMQFPEVDQSTAVIE